MYNPKLMREIQKLGFAALDLNLYLDTHPDNKKKHYRITMLFNVNMKRNVICMK